RLAQLDSPVDKRNSACPLNCLFPRADLNDPEAGDKFLRSKKRRPEITVRWPAAYCTRTPRELGSKASTHRTTPAVINEAWTFIISTRRRRQQARHRPKPRSPLQVE